jgi:hypothetical protein
MLAAPLGVLDRTASVLPVSPHFRTMRTVTPATTLMRTASVDVESSPRRPIVKNPATMHPQTAPALLMK